MGEEIDQPLAREYMQKAYVTFSTISSANKNPNLKTERARWADLVSNVANEHGKFIGEMSMGKFYSKIDKDPRDNMFADDKIDIKSLKQFNPKF